jgi:hypothetical protein
VSGGQTLGDWLEEGQRVDLRRCRGQTLLACITFAHFMGRLNMLRRFKLLLAPAFAIVLLAANLHVYDAHAHNWNNYHWDQSGSHIEIDWYNYAYYYTEAEAARVYQWNNVWNLYDYNISYHPNADQGISVFDGNSGATGWSGLATVVNTDWDWGCWCYDHVNHAHAQYNSYYGYNAWNRQYVFCQETWHTYGFDHDNSGSCMDYAGYMNTQGPHNISDFHARYG